ncbi:Asp-tRNA(Asn)/Glu-tRNA(Gln) amidotransferase A subunit family amidase [Sagittula marina]|uniref:Asp-tRNA(Asn)/Glu-tRNA(Gln) amidotransferase A subunit family amidase n=1 Tax=Sagittula marina TaxID=943940 RepID=A0A7W6DXN7_9RHOB|nr:Asp-tRNA(Asn)/Glu-tRNA(Gln) amidotransferase A subunit family amidase [Sagittula marina]
MDKPLTFHAGTARQMVEAVAAGTPPMAVAEDMIARVQQVEPAVNAFAFFDADRLRAEADALPDGPLKGVTVAVKDVLLTRDMPTAHNSARYAGSQPGIDAACVDTLRSAGALIAGKARTTEFASTTVGPGTTNPHDAARTPGGSSSGSAASVAAGMTALALGTQTGGSTIRPASFCGVFGMKPTWNAISREGSKMYSATCDTVGLYARAASDLELLADVFGFDGCDVPDSLAGLRIGISYGTTPEAADADSRAAMENGAGVLLALGAEVFDLTLPEAFDGILESHRVVLAREGASAFLNEVRATPDLGAFFSDMVAAPPTAIEARAAYRQADLCRGLLDDLFEGGLDLILAPSATGVAPEGIGTGDPTYNSMWTLMQVPVVNVPMYRTAAGLPVGVSLIGRRYEDRRVIRAASLLMPEAVAPVG